MTQQTISTEKQPWRLQPSCLFLAALIVVPPWVLIAIPGVMVSGAGTTGMSSTILEHGWPAVCAQSAHVRFTGTWKGNVFTPNAKPAPAVCQDSARSSLNAHRQVRVEKFLNWRLQTKNLDFTDNPGASYFQSRFWSDKSNWPYFSNADGYAIDWSPIGLITNVVVLAIIFLAFAAILQFRKRWTNRLWHPSLGEVLIAVTAVCVIVAMLSKEHRRATTEKKFVANILDSSNAYAEVHRKTIPDNWIHIPEVLTNLLDNRVALPGTETPLFVCVSEVSLDVFFETLDSPNMLETEDELIKGLNGLGRPIRIRSELNEQFISFINKLDLENIRELRVDFSCSYIDVEDGEAPLADKLKHFPIVFSQLQKLYVKLDSNENQAEQLYPFLLIVKSGELNVLSLDGINTSGAEFLINNASRLPEGIQCFVSSDEIDSNTLRRLAERVSVQLINYNSYSAESF